MSSHAAPAAPASATTPAAPVATPSGHFPGLEGLRALAASLVVLTHAGDLAGPGRAGWLLKPAAVGDVGVAVFFVLSGFLITGRSSAPTWPDVRRPGPAPSGGGGPCGSSRPTGWR